MFKDIQQARPGDYLAPQVNTLANLLNMYAP